MSEQVKVNIEEAIRMIESCIECAQILPEVGMNIAMALPNARSLEEVAGLTGRIIRVEGRAVGVGEPKFGATHFMGNVILAAMRHNSEFKAVINIKYSPEIVRICREFGMDTRTHDWKEKPKEAIEMKCAIPFTIEKLQEVPEVVYDLGDVGVEPLITIFGRTAVEVASKAIKIAKKYSEDKKTSN